MGNNFDDDLYNYAINVVLDSREEGDMELYMARFVLKYMDEPPEWDGDGIGHWMRSKSKRKPLLLLGDVPFIKGAVKVLDSGEITRWSFSDLEPMPELEPVADEDVSRLSMKLVCRESEFRDLPIYSVVSDRIIEHVYVKTCDNCWRLLAGGGEYDDSNMAGQTRQVLRYGSGQTV